MACGASEIAKLLRYAGYGLCVAWGFLLFSIAEFQPSGGGYFAASMVPGALLCSFLLMGSLCPSGFRTGFAFLCGALAASGTLLQVMGQFDGTPVELAGTVFGGFAFAGLLAVWFVAYSSLNVRSIFICSGFSLAICALICVAVSALPFEIAGLATSLLPLIAVLLLPNCKDTMRDLSFWGLAKIKGAFLGGMPTKAFAGLFLVYMVLDTVRITTKLPGSFFGRADASYLVVPFLVAAACVATALLRNGGFDLGALPKAVFAALGASIILSLTLSIPHYNFGFASSVCAQVLCWLFLACVAKSGELPASIVFYFGWLVEFAGGIFAQAVAPMLSGHVIAVSFVLVLIMSAAVVFIFSGKDFSIVLTKHKGKTCVTCDPLPLTHSSSLQGRIAREEAGGEAAGDERGEIVDYFEHFCAKYLLTARERDVFGLWITGHSMRHIQEELCVSQGTVKTHLRNIYDKCGVHTRDDLMHKYESEAKSEMVENH